MSTNSTRGTVLILAIFFMAVATFLAHAFLALLPTERNAAVRARLDAEATLTCRSGVEESLAWLSAQVAQGKAPEATRREGDPVMGGWRWSATVTPAGEGSYKITCAARAPRVASEARRITALVSLAPSYARWAYFDGSTGQQTLKAGLKVMGPAHFNGPLKVEKGPRFQGEVTVAGSVGGKVQEVFATTPCAQAGPVKAEWRPQDLKPQKASPQGLQVGTSGISVGGNVYRATLSADAAGNPRLDLETDFGSARILEVSRKAVTGPGGGQVAVGKTLVTDVQGQRIVDGLPGGVLYVEGDLDRLEGKAMRPLTLAVTGRAALPAGLLHAQGVPLGLVASELSLGSGKVAAALLAGTLDVSGSVELHGSLGLKQPLATGLTVRHDPALAAAPPPSFPRARGSVELQAWKEERLAP